MRVPDQDHIDHVKLWISYADEDLVLAKDGGLFRRLCSKMATGTGKTIVMAMLIAWQVLNKVTYPQDTRFSENVFIVAPGLTVKSRLQVLKPSAQGNYYNDFNIVPSGLSEKLNQGKVLIQNWHSLNWETDEKPAKKNGVDKRGAKSDPSPPSAEAAFPSLQPYPWQSQQHRYSRKCS